MRTLRGEPLGGCLPQRHRWARRTPHARRGAPSQRPAALAVAGGNARKAREKGPQRAQTGCGSPSGEARPVARPALAGQRSGAREASKGLMSRPPGSRKGLPSALRPPQPPKNGLHKPLSERGLRRERRVEGRKNARALTSDFPRLFSPSRNDDRERDRRGGNGGLEPPTAGPSGAPDGSLKTRVTLETRASMSLDGAGYVPGASGS